MSKHIQIKTPIPGPQSQALMARRHAAVPRGPFHATPIAIDHGDGAILEDVDGNRYIDFAGGLGCLNIGHVHGAVTDAVVAQAKKYLHSCFHVTANEPYIELAETLNRLAPGDFAKKTLLVNSGAEAVENAIKIARHATGRSAVICFENAFHGRTYLGMTLTSKVAPYKQGFGPFVPEVYRLPFNTCYHQPMRLSCGECQLTNADQIEHAFKTVVDAADVAAIIIEPVLGEGGFVPATPEFLQRLRQICDTHGIVLIADEIQSGFGRTGALYACEKLGLVPDLITSAKSLAAGLPLAAVTGRAELMDHPQVGGLGGTYGGSPLACVAALQVIEAMTTGGLAERANLIGERVMGRMRELAKSHWQIGDVRGIGAMVGIEFIADATTKAPAKEITTTVHRLCYERGLITITAGTGGNIMRTLMPLVITDEQLDEALDVLEGAIRDACRG
jgi:4-aminobutyrate aminotransferase/(S)-3-amino-2-methylpropionate transaminase